jgi:hypothetical protein
VGIVIVYGLLLGNVQASRCQLRAAGQIHGDITCKSMAMDPDVILIGSVNINPLAPNYIDHEGKVIGKKKPKKKKGPDETPSASVVSSPRKDKDEKEEAWKSPAPEETKENKNMSKSNSKDGKMSASNSKKSVGGADKLATSDSKKSVGGPMSASNSKTSVGGDSALAPSDSKKSVGGDKAAAPTPSDKPTPHIEPAEEPVSLEETPFSAALAANEDAIAKVEEAAAE